VRVRLHASWCGDAEIREAFNRASPAGDYRWKDLELTLDDDFDWFVVFNYPSHDEFDRSKTVVFQSEPRITRQRIAFEFGARLAGCRIVDTDSHFNFDKWYVDRSYAELREPIVKTRTLSAVVSGERLMPRHRQRLEFALNVLPRVSDLDHYGRRLPEAPTVRGELADKAEGLMPYRYTFNAENSLEPNYFTEKVLDAILCETLCFYDGCPNLEAFLDPESFVRVSMDRPDEAVEIMRSVIAGGEWERRLPAIRAQKERLMVELNPLEIIRKVLSGEPVWWRTDEELDARPPREVVDGLPPVSVISLPTATERRRRVSAHLERLGIPFSFHDAVRGDDLSPAEIAERIDMDALTRRIGRPASAPELGCALSHAEVLRQLVDSNETCAVILEDDARLADAAGDLVKSVAAGVQPGDLVLIGASGATPLRVGGRRMVGQSTFVAPAARGGVQRTFAYLVTREAAAAILEKFPRVASLADDWPLFGGVVLLRILEPRIAWTWGPFIEPSEIDVARADAIGSQVGKMQHSFLARLGYKARLIAAEQPRIGWRLVKIADVLELVSLTFRGFRLRRAAARA
jgi:glycosyl transferase family 25